MRDERVPGSKPDTGGQTGASPLKAVLRLLKLLTKLTKSRTERTAKQRKGQGNGTRKTSARDSGAFRGGLRPPGGPSVAVLFGRRALRPLPDAEGRQERG
ncbi:hypothetical protein SKAU_G00340950 [Synaphobranchus kaupii]|uniref:Uncharacterized protein n=1 Tax=Synaphobranchus kaupii TaxID=118154 RepID=A0A9Q1IJI7_SYNKA|nr:hypothetical protein SKAU_G00340950 [Synaphobranchus kaupii]